MKQEHYIGRVCPNCGDPLIAHPADGVVICARRRMPSCEYMEPLPTEDRKTEDGRQENGRGGVA